MNYLRPTVIGLLAMIVLGVAIASCGDSEPPTPLTASASILESNSLIAAIEGSLDKPGEVYVEYGREGDPSDTKFRTKAVPSDGTDYLVHVVRLRAESKYTYKVFGTDDDGDAFEGPAGTFTTGPLPERLQDTSFDVLTGQPTQDLTLLDFRADPFRGAVAIDGEGHIVWYYDAFDHSVSVLAQKPNGNIVYIIQGDTQKGFAMREITPLGEEVDRVEAECSPNGPWHHEVQLLSGNKVMILSRDIQESFNNPDRLQEGDTIAIWDQTTGETTIVWNIFDFVDPTVDRTPDSDMSGGVMWRGCSGREPSQDWTHGNSAIAAPDGSVLYSARHLDQIISIAPDFQSLNWRLGGPGGDFTFPDPSDQFYHQHAATPLPNGNVLLFDNGNGRPAEEGGEYSRALELELDLNTMEARKVWEYRHEPSLFAACCSIAHRLDNGNTLIVFGSPPDFGSDVCCRTFTIVEADSQGNAVWVVEERSPQKSTQYRVYPSDSVMGETRLQNP